MRKASNKRTAPVKPAPVPDEQIDTSDIPEVTDWRGATRGALTRSTLISIRISPGDLVMANQFAHAKGLPYQTYLKSIIHQALMDEARRRQES